MSLAAGSRLGPYEIAAPIGAGGMGEVYRGRDTRLERLVAIKVLHSELCNQAELRERFEREARAVSSLNHPHICILYDVGQAQTDQGPLEFLVMEYLEGETLDRRLSRGALPLEETLRYAIEIAAALDHAHRRGIVHRDLKPSNILITAGGSKLLDFGIAKLRALAPYPEPAGTPPPPTEDRSLTASGNLVGTPRYMSPEQLLGAPVDARSDLFAFGLVAYEMATGRRAFSAPNQAALAHAILHKKPEPIAALDPSAPAACSRAIETCLAKDPDARWQTARDLLRELEWIAQGRYSAPAARPRRRAPMLAAWLGALLLPWVLGWALTDRGPAAPQAPIRFTLRPAGHTSFGDTTIALAPEGQRLVYSATTPDGRRALWLRHFNASQARRLAGTEDAIFPFWSPDGRALAFFAAGELRRFELPHGPVETICVAPEGRGGSWSRDGTILFAPDSRSGLLRVPAAGGTPQPATALEPGRHETSHRWPWFLPDGRSFLYMSWSGREQDRGIYLGSLDGGAAARLTGSVSSMALAPSGELLFVRDQTLIGQPLDLKARRLSGEPFQVAQSPWSDFSFISGLTAFSVSNGGVLAYRRGGPTVHRLVWFDRGGRALEALEPEAAYFDLMLSPRGERLVVSRGDAQGASDLWLFDLGRGIPSRLTVDASDDAFPLWTPDGNQIVFSSGREGVEQLYRKPASGARPEQPLLRSEQSKYASSFTPDGRFLLFETLDPVTKQDLWLFELGAASEPAPFLRTPFNEGAARISPDGQWVAYCSDESGRPEIFVADFPARADRWQVSSGGAVNPMWRADGRELFYLSAEGDLMAATVQPGRSDFEIAAPRILFRTPIQRTALSEVSGPRQIAAAPDGRRFLINVRGARSFEAPITVVLHWR